MFEIGNSLREARVRKGLGFPEVELATKIRGKYLRALEEEDFEILPGDTYVRGFLRAYAEHLGLDGQLYVDEYLSRFGVNWREELPPQRVRRAGGARQRTVERRAVLLALAGIAAVTVLVFVAWKFGGVDLSRSTPSVVSTTASSKVAPRQARAARRRQGHLRRGAARRPRPARSFCRGRSPAAAVESLAGARASTSSCAARRGCASSSAARPSRCRRAGTCASSSRPSAPSASPGDRPPPAGRDRRHGQRARPRRAHRPQRPVPRRARRSRLGLEPARITIVGDSPAELEAALREGLEADACLVSGGLGPTHDDRTVEMVARAAGVELVVDPELEREIEAVSRAAAERLRRPYADFAPGVTKQATRPEGALVARPRGHGAGARPARTERRASSSSCPGRRASCSACGRARSRREPVRELLARARPPGRRVLRSSASASRRSRARSPRRAGTATGSRRRSARATSRSTSTSSSSPGAEARADALERGLVEPLERWLFAPRRAPRRGARARALPRAGPDARDRRVVHGRARGGAADLGAGLERRLRRAGSSPTRTR